MLHTISAKTEHPEAAATLVNFLVNSPQSGEIFGTNRGLPASETALAAAELDPLSQQIADYEASIADRLGDAPPVPIVGYGTLEEKFRQLGIELELRHDHGRRSRLAVLRRDGRRPQPVNRPRAPSRRAPRTQPRRTPTSTRRPVNTNATRVSIGIRACRRAEDRGGERSMRSCAQARA